MPSRMLHEAICTSKKLASVSFEAEALYYRLLVKADDYGRYFATPKIIENACFTAGKPSQIKADKCLKELAEQGLVIVYKSSDEPYLYITGWETRQRIRNSTSKFPAPPVQDAPKENALPKEEDIEDVLYETLTGSASFNNEEIISIERQVRAKESYLDVVAKSAENTYLFELKRNRLSNKSIDQIAGYLDLIDGYGILMGCGVAPNFSFERCEKNGIAVLTYDNEEFKVSVAYKPHWYVQRDFTLNHGKQCDSSLAAVNVNVNVNEDVNVNGDEPAAHGTPHSEIVAAYHRLCPSFPKLRSVSDSRKDKLRTRWQEHPSLDEWEEAFAKMEDSDFLRGVNDRKWKATFDWLIDNDKNMVKVLEGNYDNKGREADHPMYRSVN
jgi:hypothetical protein